MADELPDGTKQGYSTICPKCGETVPCNAQGTIYNHPCANPIKCEECTTEFYLYQSKKKYGDSNWIDKVCSPRCYFRKCHPDKPGTDIDAFKALYKRFGITCIEFIDKNTGDRIIFLQKNNEYRTDPDYTYSDKFDGYNSFFSEVVFSPTGEFIKQGFWE